MKRKNKKKQMDIRDKLEPENYKHFSGYGMLKYVMKCNESHPI